MKLIIPTDETFEKARRKAAPGQLLMFGAGGAPTPQATRRKKSKTAAPAPTSSNAGGWQPIPNGKHGGQRRRKGNGWEYRYPDGKGGWQSKPPKKAGADLAAKFEAARTQAVVLMQKLVDAPVDEGQRLNIALFIQAVLRAQSRVKPELRRWARQQLPLAKRLAGKYGEDYRLLGSQERIGELKAARRKADREPPRAPIELDDGYKGKLLKAWMSIDEAGQAIKGAPVEHLALFMGSLAQRYEGKKHHVDVDNDVLVRAQRHGHATVVHNHPTGSCFSNNDVMMTLNWNLREMRATRRNGEVWVLRRLGSDWGDLGGHENARKLRRELNRLERGAKLLAQGDVDLWLDKEHDGWLRRFVDSGGKLELPEGTQEHFRERLNTHIQTAYNDYLSGLGEVVKLPAPGSQGDQAGRRGGLAADVRSKPTPETVEAANPRTLTPAFKRWFGDWTKGKGSAVVKADGSPDEQYGPEPLPVFHGTAVGGFTRFSKDKDKGANIFGQGFYFTEDRSIAEEYTAKDENERWSSTTHFTNAKGVEITHLTKHQVGELRKAAMDNQNPNYSPNLMWAIHAAEQPNGSVNLRKLIEEFWSPSGTRQEHWAVLSKVEPRFHGSSWRPNDPPKEGKYGFSDALYGADYKGSMKMGRWSGPRMVEHVLKVLGAKLETVKDGWSNYQTEAADSKVRAVQPEGQVFEVYLNIRKPVDMDQPAPFEAVRRMSKAFAKRATEKYSQGGPSTYVSHIKDLKDTVDFVKLGVAFNGDHMSLEITPENLLKVKQAAVDATKGETYEGRQVMGSLHSTPRDTLTWGDVHYIMTDMHRWDTEKKYFTEWAKGEGYDGIAHTGGWNIGAKNHRVWIAFEPNQIKATDSKGFDPTTDDITKASAWLDDLLQGPRLHV